MRISHSWLPKWAQHHHKQARTNAPVFGIETDMAGGGSFDTFPKLLLRNAAMFCARPAFRHKNLGIWQTWTWAQVAEIVRAYAAGLHRLGLQPGDKIAVVGSNRPKLYWTIMAAQALRAIPVPVYSDAVADELAFVLAHAEAKFVAAQNQEQVDKVLSVSDRVPHLHKIVYDEPRGLDDYDHSRLIAIHDVIEDGRAALAADAALGGQIDEFIRQGRGSDMAIILYTSGTTGASKGVMLSARGCIDAATDTVSFDRLSVGERPGGRLGSSRRPPEAATVWKGLRVSIPKAATATETGAPVLLVNNIEVVYDHVILVLKGVSLDVPRGGIVALLGANGAGKTTTLKAISNLLHAERGEVTKGSILFDGVEVQSLSPNDLVRRGCIQVMEGRRCFAHLTVEENLLTGAFTRRDGNSAIAQDLERVYAYFPRLKERRGSTAGYTSGGEQQMCVIGRALMSRPKMILLDEPSMGLAPQIVEEIFEIVKDLNIKEGVSFLLAEQNTNMALKYASHGYILENGRVVMDGEARALAANEDVKEFYLGVAGEKRKSFRDVKHYKRRKRWLA
jgi:branched-chain amino acid transport system ATP-binding protein